MAFHFPNSNLYPLQNFNKGCSIQFLVNHLLPQLKYHCASWSYYIVKETLIMHSVMYPRYQAIATYCMSHTFDFGQHVVQQQTIVVVLTYDRIKIDHCISPALYPVKKSILSHLNPYRKLSFI